MGGVGFPDGWGWVSRWVGLGFQMGGVGFPDWWGRGCRKRERYKLTLGMNIKQEQKSAHTNFELLPCSGTHQKNTSTRCPFSDAEGLGRTLQWNPSEEYQH